MTGASLRNKVIHVKGKNLLTFCSFSPDVTLKMKSRSPKPNTGDSRYVDFAYLDTITYVEVIFHSQLFFSIYLCISTPSMSKTVNMKQRISRGDLSCPRRIFYYICYCLCRSKNRPSQGRRIVCFGYVYALHEVRKSSKQWSKTIKVLKLLSIEQLILYLAQLNQFTVLTRNHTQYR